MVSRMCEVPLERHELRLQVGREAGERLRRDFDRRDLAAVAGDADALIGGRHGRAGLADDVERGLQ